MKQTVISIWPFGRYGQILTAVVVIGMLGSCDAMVNSNHHFSSAISQDSPATQPPTTPVELIQNINLAVASNLFLDDDTFTNDEKLWQLFAGKRILRSHPMTSAQRGFDLTFFPPSIDAAELNPKTPTSSRLSFGVEIINDRVSISLLNASGLNLGLADIEKLFGHDWKYATPPRHPELLRLDMKPHLGKRIEYWLSAVRYPYKAKAVMAFDTDDRFIGMTISMWPQNIRSDESTDLLSANVTIQGE